MQVVKASTKLYRDRDLTAPVETELLIGEIFDEDYVDFGWVHGKARLDGYQGYVRLSDLRPGEWTMTHRISAVRTIGYAAPDIKSSAIEWLSINSLGCVEEELNGFTRFNGIWVPTQDVAKIDGPTPNQVSYVEVARAFIGTPYLWGGRDANHGVDCSGLVQQALLATNRSVPRDSGPQSQSIGYEFDRVKYSFRPGDFVFWKGHVGIVGETFGGATLIHATADFMRVVEEPLDEVIDRRDNRGEGEPICYRRLSA